MSQERLISQELVQTVVGLIVTTLPWAKNALTFELQADFQFLLISVECNNNPKLREGERRELGGASQSTYANSRRRFYLDVEFYD